MNCFKYSTDSEIDLIDRSSTHVFDSTCSHLSTFSITILKIAFERHHPPSFYFCASVRVAREIDQGSDACVRFSPSFLQFLHFLRANFDSLSLSPCFLPPPTHGAHCPSASRLHRNTVTYPHGNRYSARGYRTLISSYRTHIPGFVETVHRTVSFGYSRDT